MPHVCFIKFIIEWTMNKYLKHFVATLNTRASAVLGELALVMPRCRIINSVGRFCLLLFVCGTCCR